MKTFKDDFDDMLKKDILSAESARLLHHSLTNYCRFVKVSVEIEYKMQH